MQVPRVRFKICSTEDRFKICSTEDREIRKSHRL